MRSLLYDLRFALRQLRKSPGFTVTAALILALGIGANTAIFSLVHSILLRQLPFRDADRVFDLDRISGVGLGHEMDATDQAATFRQNAKSFSSLEDAAMYSVQPANFSFDGAPARLSAAEVSARFLDVLKVKPVIGRGFAATEDTPGEDHVALISDRLWERNFFRSPSALGQTLHINAMTFTVIGVLPPEMDFPSRADAWVPTIFDQHTFLREGGAFYTSVIVRLAPGVAVARAQAELTVRAESLRKAESHGGETLPANERPVLTPIAAELTASIRPSLLLLSGAVFFLLMVVCANLATLMLVRTADRRNEFAVRAALGAPRGSLMRQQFVESGLLAVVGASAGTFLAYGALAALYRFRPVVLAQFPPPAIEKGVLIFTTGLAVATGLLFGIGPAWTVGHQDPGEILKARGRSVTPSHNRLRRALVCGEIAVAFALLVGAMLLVRTIHNLNQVPLGFEIQNRLTFTVALHGEMYKKDGSMGLFYDNALERLAHLPGVTGAAAISILPLDRRPDMYLSVSGNDPNFLLYAAPRVASSRYFGTMGMPLIRGRDFSTQDRRGTDRVVVVTQDLAKKLWPGENPLGQRLRSTFFCDPFATVIGVVAPIHVYGPRQNASPEYYVPYAQVDWPSATFVIRTKTDPETLLESARRVIAGLDSTQPIFNVETMRDRLRDRESLERFQGFALSVFAGISLFLALIGLHGVVSYSVAQRTREIGLRLALGAQRGDVLGMFVRESVTVTSVGLAVGLLAALGLTRFLSSILYDLLPSDPVTIAGTALIFFVIASLGTWLSARRAAKVDPMVALRYE